MQRINLKGSFQDHLSCCILPLPAQGSYEGNRYQETVRIVQIQCRGCSRGCVKLTQLNQQADQIFRRGKIPGNLVSRRLCQRQGFVQSPQQHQGRDHFFANSRFKRVCSGQMLIKIGSGFPRSPTRHQSLNHQSVQFRVTGDKSRGIL